jgi:murein DD-endopeptidase MepM/ murein hydrolase activator NlpD
VIEWIKSGSRALLYVFILSGFVTASAHADYIEDDKLRFKGAYQHCTPEAQAEQWFLPFDTPDRTDIKTMRVVSVFGSDRQSFRRGHIHTGLDMNPKEKNKKHVNVYAMANGVVESVHLGHPHKTIVIKHDLPDGKVVFTSYKHLESIYVENGVQVTQETKLGRLYTRKEAKAQGGNYDHLHLEIRKQFDDYGVASWSTMSKQALKKRFYDPYLFMQENIP